MAGDVTPIEVSTFSSVVVVAPGAVDPLVSIYVDVSMPKVGMVDEGGKLLVALDVSVPELGGTTGVVVEYDVGVAD